MKVQTERLPKSVARLEIELDQDRVNKEVDRAAKRISNQVSIPGFRKGKAPRVLVERFVGEDYILSEATKQLVPDAIADALEQESLDPVAEPEDFNLLESDPFRFEVTVPLVPTVILGDYKSVRAERQEVSISEEEVDEVVNQLREDQSEWIDPDPERPAKDGDQLTLRVVEDIEGRDGSDEEEDLVVELGKHQLMEPLESKLIGVEKGKEYDYEITLPEDYHEADVAGHQAKYHIEVKDLKEKRVPETDDEWAKGLNLQVETMADLRDRIRGNIRSQKESDERNRLVDEVVTKIVDLSTVEMPDVLVEREIDHQIQHLRQEIERIGMTFDQYLQYSNKSAEEFREEYREGAEKRVIRGLVLSEVAKAENIEIDESEINREIERITGGVEEAEAAKARELLETQQWHTRLESELYDRKVLDRVVEIATGSPLFEETAGNASEEATTPPEAETSEASAEAGDVRSAEASASDEK